MIGLSGDQKAALSNLISWFNSENKIYITLGGYAGTGKTTLIGILRQNFFDQNKKLKVAFCTFTGKASRVLRSKLIEAKALFPLDFVGTIHSLIYSPIEDEKTKEIIGWKRKDEIEADLIIVDEASMVDIFIWQDLLSYKIPIIAVGDHGQLPPIRENFNLMQKPDLKLEEIHRQAKENPIIKLSIMARETGKIPISFFGRNVKKISYGESDSWEAVEELLKSYNEDTMILCGYNKTRIKINDFIRNSLGFESPVPQTRDRVVCLRNNRAKGIFNGMLGSVFDIKDKEGDFYKARIAMDGEEGIYKGLIYKAQFGAPEPINFTKERFRLRTHDIFDFGYALTVHKAQGSQAKRVILFEERFSKSNDDEWRRWLYTGITRAEEELFIIG
ncbi:hypothetical protein COS55_02475 [Candidatus Shapirobacteria bacterium CG03_land_8_20_14_0_80_40_19]|uniref:UvrD-like helicase C-terminal domain-containing protein n=3 Tax=Candidatus Shapironibacteriota TaxID=1752721 RepID=A0A2M7BD91_9BACT|nr:MAG: hypothetical protein COS55_02475 [Candidatus Shapirobacteria bacterium CG03_land_8_20_14_0_80_40_19]PJC28493.1 MAG: hypothetical protein CO053_04280 [Candidatus Shapirobacteria bacterium CG_4_9_14_0_2_um_filter_40_11]